MQFINRPKPALLIAAIMGLILTSSTWSQDLFVDTAYVPFIVNTAAMVTAVPDVKGLHAGWEVISPDARIEVVAGEETILRIPLFKKTGVRFDEQRQTNVPRIISGKGKVAVILSTQSQKSVEISIYSVNGKRILHNNMSVANTERKITNRYVAPGMYLLSIKGNGCIVSSRLAHNGGILDISVISSTENRSSSDQYALVKKTVIGGEDYGIQVQTLDWQGIGYYDTIYTLNVVEGMNPLQNINLRGYNNCKSWESCRKVKIGNKVWTAENLNAFTSGSIGHGYWSDEGFLVNTGARTEIDGSYYQWEAAERACPGHLATFEEWKALGCYREMGCESLGFTDLYGGYYLRNGVISGKTGSGIRSGYWWVSDWDVNVFNRNERFYVTMSGGFFERGTFPKNYYLSARCVQDSLE